MITLGSVLDARYRRAASRSERPGRQPQTEGRRLEDIAWRRRGGREETRRRREHSSLSHGTRCTPFGLMASAALGLTAGKLFEKLKTESSSLWWSRPAPLRCALTLRLGLPAWPRTTPHDLPRPAPPLVLPSSISDFIPRTRSCALGIVAAVAAALAERGSGRAG